MSLKNYEFEFGKSTQTVALPEEHVSDIMNGRGVPAVDDIKAATIDCMRNPIGSAPLQEKVTTGDKVCLVVADITRTWNKSNQFLIYIIDELNEAGIPDDDIYIVFAQGTHRPQTHEEDITVCGKEVIDRIKTYQHDCKDPSLVNLGETKLGTPILLNKHVVDADKVIIVDGITIHLFAGYGGGRKLILPGVAGFETIQKNHCHALAENFGEGINPQTRSTLLKGNPLHDDLVEACQKINPCFLVHSVINPDGEICRMVGGDWYDAWLDGTKSVLDIVQAPMKEKADVVFASAGGYPKDINLYQSCKTYDVAEMAVKKGGIIITIIEAQDIKEPAAYMDSFRFDSMSDMEKALREEFTIPFFVAFNLYCLCHDDTVIMVTKPENFAAVRRTGQTPVATVEEAWKLAQNKLAEQGKTEDYTINILPHCSSVVPVQACPHHHK